MNPQSEKCFTCLESNSEEFHDINNHDKDHISYWEKLKACIGSQLIKTEEMWICLDCVKQLQISYKFRNLVLKSQETLMEQSNRKGQTSDSCREDEDFDDEMLNEAENFLQHHSQNDFDIVSNDEELLKNDPDNSMDIEEFYIEKLSDDQESNDCFYHCDLCDTKFNKEWKLKRHSTRVHNIIRKYVCEYCQKEFKQSFHLKEHRSTHTGEKNFTCSICGKQFQRLSSQKRHERAHERPPGEKTKKTPFLCTICGKSFPFSNGVQRHMRVHSDIKKFECHLCKKRFRQSTHLHVHMRTHTGEKPFICDTCGEKFSLKSLLLRHIRNYHEYNDKNGDDRTTPETVAASTTTTIEFVYLPKDIGDCL